MSRYVVFLGLDLRFARDWLASRLSTRGLEQKVRKGGGERERERERVPL